MTPEQLALARSHTYALLAQLFQEGLTEENRPYTAAVPELAETLPDPFDADEAAAVHHRLFHFNVFPYESIFLDPSGLVGGTAAGRVGETYRRAGFRPGTGRLSGSGSEADHVAHELSFLSFLGGAEAGAWRDERPQVAGRMADLAGAFLRSHLLRWLPPFVLAVRRQRDPFYSALASLTLELAAAQWAVGRGSNGPTTFALPEPPALLDNSTGLREVAVYLLAPPHSGLYLSRDDIGRLAHSQELPRGFGGREQMLLNLWRAAGSYDRSEPLLAALRDVAAGWVDAYQTLPMEIAPFARVWAERAGRTVALLAEMAGRLGERSSFE